jgi:putative flippase GtrA
MRFINRGFYRFVFWGGVNTLVSYLIYAFLLQFLPYLAAYTVAYILGIFISYFLNSKYVFKQKLSLRKAAQYPLVYLTQYLLGTILLYVLVQVLLINKLVAPALIVLLTIPVTYFLSRRIVEGKPKIGEANLS